MSCFIIFSSCKPNSSDWTLFTYNGTSHTKRSTDSWLSCNEDPLQKKMNSQFIYYQHVIAYLILSSPANASTIISFCLILYVWNVRLGAWTWQHHKTCNLIPYKARYWCKSHYYYDKYYTHVSDNKNVSVSNRR